VTIFFLIQIYKLVLVLPLCLYSYLSLLVYLCHESPPLWISLYHFFVNQILFLWLITSISYCHLDLVVVFFYRFYLSIWLFIFYLGYFFILIFFLALVTNVFVVSHYLIRTFFWCYHISSSSHNLISLLVIYGNASHHLFFLTRWSVLHSMMILKSQNLNVIFLFK
jgi:hypothetical protein